MFVEMVCPFLHRHSRACSIELNCVSTLFNDFSYTITSLSASFYITTLLSIAFNSNKKIFIHENDDEKLSVDTA